MLFLTIPTAHSHPELLAGIIRDCSLPLEQIILIATKPDLSLPAGCVVIEDPGPPNIQRWWNAGIEEATKRGATAVAVLNDDLKINSETLPKLHGELQRTNATIASPTRPDWGPGHYKNSNLFPYTPVIWGCLWMLNIDSHLRPDPKYVWWYGDSDLDIRARRDYSGIVTADVYYEHYFPGEGTRKSDKLQSQTDIDAQTFELEYKDFLKKSRATKPRKLFIQTDCDPEYPNRQVKCRKSFFEFVDSAGDRNRDRVVLIEPDARHHKSLLELWENWTNVIIHIEYLQFFDLVHKVSDGAELELLSCDSISFLSEHVATNSLLPREIHVQIKPEHEGQIRDLGQQLGYTLNGHPLPEDTATMSLISDLSTNGGNRVETLAHVRNAIFKRRGEH